MLRYTKQILPRRTLIQSPPCHLFSTSSILQSHIGRTPITFSSQDITIDHNLTAIKEPRIPSEMDNTMLTIKGPLGQLHMPIKPYVKLNINNDNTNNGESVLQVSVDDATIKEQRSMWGTTRNLIRNMIIGVSEGYRIHLRLVGVGYRGVLENNNRSISLKLGYSHPITVDLPEGITCTIPQPNRIVLQGTDLQQVTELAATIQRWRKPEPYNQKGIFINDETIKKKEGKKK
ncbi:ribosomal protein L6, alpha-beta domain-containing protein [Cunninghamella echinulata]|nr:ribosomal protein L6, alpha-beta domain-containing protein [Cunninghamella echinulata]